MSPVLELQICTRLKHKTDVNKRTAPTSRVNYCHLTSPEKSQKLMHLDSSLRTANHHRDCLEAATAACGEALDEQTQ